MPNSRAVKTVAIFSLVLFFCFCFTVNGIAAAPTFPGGLIIDHNAARDFDSIPAAWIQAAKEKFRLSYGHTSHGSQIVTGMAALSAAYPLYYNYTYTTYLPESDAFLCDTCLPADLGSGTWAAETRNSLNGSGSNRNVIMWSWCGQVSGASEADIADSYLANMAQLEQDFPDVSFIYMTGHLDGTGESGNLNIRNNQIRNYVKSNNKVLFDFADIESFDPTSSTNYMLLYATDGCYYNNYQNNWASQWITENPNADLTQVAASCGDCAHSEKLNCVMKGRAFWYMMARLAGWEGPVPLQYTLTVNKAGSGNGTVTGAGKYDPGTTAEVTATAAKGSVFSGWSGDCGGTTSPTTVLMDGAKTCVATFAQLYSKITARAKGTGAGSVVSIPTGISYKYPAKKKDSGTYKNASTVKVTARAIAGSKASWNNTCRKAGGKETGNNTRTAVCTIKVAKAAAITAILKKR